LKPTTRPKSEKLEVKEASITVDKNYYVYTFNTMGN
jgi:hypothetical protein